MITTHNRDLMAQARASLAGKWGGVIGAFIVYNIIYLLISIIPVAGIVIQLLIAGPFTLGWTCYVLKLARGEPVTLGLIFSGFNDFLRAFVTFLLTSIYIFLWTLLLIVPGILAILNYSMTYYILLDNPGMGANDAIGLSKKMMYGHRWKYFCLCWRFFGWLLLCIVTFGIAVLWVQPYIMVTIAKFYDDTKRVYAEPTTENPAPAAT